MESESRAFINKMFSGDEKMKKQGEYSLTSYVRNLIVEGGIVRSGILPPINISETQLDRDEDPTILKKFIEVEPSASSATWVPFRGMPEARLVKARFSPVYFGTIWSEEHTANIWELKTSNTDLRKLLQDNDVKVIQDAEDEAFIDRVDAICDANPTAQHFDFYGGLSKNNWAAARRSFFARKPIKFCLMNLKTYTYFSTWDYDADFGGGYAADMTQTGRFTSTLHGINIVTTIKDNIVPDDYAYFFAPEDFLGKLLVLQEPITYVKQEKQWVQFSTNEVIGIGIPNTESFIRVVFHPEEQAPV